MKVSKEAARLSRWVVQRHPREVVVIEFKADARFPKFGMKQGERWLMSYRRSVQCPEPPGQAYSDHATAFAFAGGQCLHSQVIELYRGNDCTFATALVELDGSERLYSDVPLNLAARLLGYTIGPPTKLGRKQVTTPDGEVLDISAGSLWEHLRTRHPELEVDDPRTEGEQLVPTDIEETSDGEVLCLPIDHDMRDTLIRHRLRVAACRARLEAPAGAVKKVRAVYEHGSRSGHSTIADLRKRAASVAWDEIMAAWTHRIDWSEGLIVDGPRVECLPKSLRDGAQVGAAARLVARDEELHIMTEDKACSCCASLVLANVACCLRCQLIPQTPAVARRAGFTFLEDARIMDDDAEAAVVVAYRIELHRRRLRQQLRRYQLAVHEHLDACRDATVEADTVDVLDWQRRRERRAFEEQLWLAHECNYESDVAAMARVLERRRRRAQPHRVHVHGQPMDPSNGEPYTFESADEAERMAKVCYPDHQSVVTIEPTTPAAATTKDEERMINVNPERVAFARKSAGIGIKEVDRAVLSKAHEGRTIGKVRVPRRKIISIAVLETPRETMVSCYEWQLPVLQQVLGVREGWLTSGDPMPTMEGQRIKDMLGK